METELAGPIPRAARYTRTTKKTRLFSFSLLVIGLSIVAYLAYNDLHDLVRLYSDGLTTQGIIYDKTSNVIYTKSGPITHYNVSYSYVYEGRTLSAFYETNKEAYDKTSVNDLITVTLLPDDPDVHREGIITEDWIHAEQGYWIIIAGLTGLVLGGLCLATEIPYRRNLRLLRLGNAIQGHIACWHIMRDKTINYAISYQFSVGGKTYTGSAGVNYEWFVYWSEGMPITILYDRRHPSRNIAYRTLYDVTLSAQ